MGLFLCSLWPWSPAVTPNPLVPPVLCPSVTWEPGGGCPRCPWGQEPSPRGSHGEESGGQSLCPPSSALSPPLGDTGEMETGVGDTIIPLHGTGVTSVHLTTTSLTLSPHPYSLFMSRYKTKMSSSRGAGAAAGLGATLCTRWQQRPRLRL